MVRYCKVKKRQTKEKRDVSLRFFHDVNPPPSLGLLAAMTEFMYRNVEADHISVQGSKVDVTRPGWCIWR